MRRILVVTLACITAAQGATAQSPACGVDASLTPAAYLERCVAPLLKTDGTTMAGSLHAALHDLRSPTLLNPALGEAERLSGKRNLLRGLHLDFVNVQSSGDPHVGVQYGLTRSVARTPHRQGVRHAGYDLTLSAQGLLVANADQNPQPVLRTALSPHFFLSYGGALDSAAIAGHLDEIRDSIAAYEAAQTKVDSAKLTGLLAGVWNRLSTQAYFIGGLQGRYETDQTFDRSQWVYGGVVGLDVKAWKYSSRLARFNIVDWPAAAIRWATGVDASFRPSGSAIPTAKIALERISPTGHPERLVLDGLDDHTRFGVELAYRSLLAQTREGRVWLEMGFHHFTELDPGAAIKDAGLHRFNRFIAVLQGPSGINASWATGALPLDMDRSDVYGVGLRLRF